MASHCTGTSALPPRASLASLATLSSVQTCHSNPGCYFQKDCCCNLRFWLSYRHHTIDPVLKYGSYKQCLLRHLPSCTKPFRGLYGEKREKKMFPKIIPTGERREKLCVKWVIMIFCSPLFGLNLNLSFSNLISSGVNFFDNLRKKTPTTPQSSATDSSSPRWVSWCFVWDSFV